MRYEVLEDADFQQSASPKYLHDGIVQLTAQPHELLGV